MRRSKLVRRRLGATLLVALGAGACATGPQPESGPPITVEVQNNNFRDATVWAIREGERQRLGVVVGKSDQSFQVDWKPNFYLRLTVRFLGGGACETGNISMEPGQRYVLDLQPDLRLNLDCKLIGSPWESP